MLTRNTSCERKHYFSEKCKFCQQQPNLTEQSNFWHQSFDKKLQAEEQSSKLKAGREGRLEGTSGTARHRLTDRTTKLLIVILILFLIAEFPLVQSRPLVLVILFVFRESWGCFQPFVEMSSFLHASIPLQKFWRCLSSSTVLSVEISNEFK